MKIKTLEEAKNFLRGNYKKGCTCPACGQFVKLYKRKLNTSMAYTLLRLFRKSQSNQELEFFHITDILGVAKDVGTGSELSKLKYWEMVDELEKDPSNTTSRTSGFWKITKKGEKFVKNELTVPEYILLYNSELRGFEGNQINIIRALGNKFNYVELMNQ
jgi:hypothetical protein